MRHTKMFHKYHFQGKLFLFGFSLGLIFWYMGKFDLVELGLVSWTNFFLTGVLPAALMGYFIAFVTDGEEMSYNNHDV